METILNVVVIVLLIAVMMYGFALNRRISTIQNSKKDLAKLFKTFDVTIYKAQTSVEELKQASNEAANGLQKAIDRALILYDDLSYMNERAEKTATKIEKIVVASRPLDKKNIGDGSVRAENIKKQQEKFTKQDEIANNAKIEIQREKLKQSGNITTKQEALEKLLTKMSEQGANQSGGNDNRKLRKEDAVVADALKALGYGKSKK